MRMIQSLPVTLTRNQAYALLMYLPRLADLNKDCAPGIAAELDTLGKDILVGLFRHGDEGAENLARAAIADIKGVRKSSKTKRGAK